MILPSTPRLWQHLSVEGLPEGKREAFCKYVNTHGVTGECHPLAAPLPGKAGVRGIHPGQWWTRQGE
jgi:hypothetical protein